MPDTAKTRVVDASAPPDGAPAYAYEVSVVMPCLNEARTLGTCIDKAHRALAESGRSYEIVVGDNGSTDGSQRIAVEHGARLVDVTKRGYGNAYLGAIRAAGGRVVVIGDSDDSYDWLSIVPFVDKVEEGYDLVMGSRFKGGIAPGAMPPLHRYIGNPILTGILNLFFRAGISDAHCGMRAFTRAAFDRLQLKTGGMEFASEMVIRAAQEGLRIGEIPTTLSKDGRDRPPHLRSFRDGWRHLRFMLMFSPSWLFVVPGAAVGLAGFILVALLPFLQIELFGHMLSFHFSIAGSMLTILAVALLQLAVAAKVVLVGNRIGKSPIGEWFLDAFHLEIFVVAGVALAAAGAAVNAAILYMWIASDFGAVSPTITSLVILGVTAVVVGVQLVFSSFFVGILRATYTGIWID
jgi:glycosyltransferase involved in cell wall biosynthesis